MICGCRKPGTVGNRRGGEKWSIPAVCRVIKKINSRGLITRGYLCLSHNKTMMRQIKWKGLNKIYFGEKHSFQRIQEEKKCNLIIASKVVRVEEALITHSFYQWMVVEFAPDIAIGWGKWPAALANGLANVEKATLACHLSTSRSVQPAIDGQKTGRWFFATSPCCQLTIWKAVQMEAIRLR